ncbi:uncharacterized protein LOC112347965 [Selaginella moellendorffii]|uniref:uncharacterized protein LOC112347965 n=1 Tax=Selaginella moellendorffii TaxID=88036 RepID=UPI000D1C85C4|nr:uncharacterized protein LOC112347965 [Selaginella moellendorffii]|eukprot:XP_024535535.1 uncharacterized protein LOC112347965 [Selaginella moellendorffii]
MKKKPPSPPPFSESTGLLELVTPPKPHLVDRRLDASSCCRQLMLQESPQRDAAVGKENRSARKYKQSKAMNAKNVLGERSVNLDRGAAPEQNVAEQVEILGENLNDQEPRLADQAGCENLDRGGSAEKMEDQAKESSVPGAVTAFVMDPAEIQEGGEVMELSPNPSDISKTILDILEDDSTEVEKPPYHPVSNPFSPRPRFLRLKRGGKAQQPYDPESNPLSPRPEFLRYNPVKHREFVQAHETGRVEKALVFSDVGSDDGQAPELSGLKRSASCPDLTITDDQFPLPPLGKTPAVSLEGKAQADTQECNRKIPVASGQSVILRRALLLLLSLSFLATACVELRGRSGFFRDLGQKIVFRTPERRTSEAEGYPGNWGIVTGVSNHSLLMVPEVRERILLSVYGEDGDDAVITLTTDELRNVEVAAALTDTEVSEANEPGSVEAASDEVDMVAEQKKKLAESSGKCSRFEWEESVAKMCLEKTIFRHTPGGELPVPTTTTFEAAVTEIEGLEDAALLEFFKSIAGEPMDHTRNSSTPGLLGQRFANMLGSLSRSLRTSLWSKLAVESLSVLGVAGTAIIWLRKRRRAGVARASAVAPLATFSRRGKTQSVATRETMTTTSSEESGSGSTSTNEDYGSFTAMEPLDSRGEIKITPVRRSSRIRGRGTQSPMLRG